jgi:hypothetical protein
MDIESKVCTGANPFDGGKPYDGKLSRTVWGKRSGDRKDRKVLNPKSPMGLVCHPTFLM